MQEAGTGQENQSVKIMIKNALCGTEILNDKPITMEESIKNDKKTEDVSSSSRMSDGESESQSLPTEALYAKSEFSVRTHGSDKTSVSGSYKDGSAWVLRPKRKRSGYQQLDLFSDHSHFVIIIILSIFAAISTLAAPIMPAAPNLATRPWPGFEAWDRNGEGRLRGRRQGFRRNN